MNRILNLKWLFLVIVFQGIECAALADGDEIATDLVPELYSLRPEIRQCSLCGDYDVGLAASLSCLTYTFNVIPNTISIYEVSGDLVGTPKKPPPSTFTPGTYNIVSCTVTCLRPDGSTYTDRCSYRQN